MKIGIFLGYGPNTVLSKEGLGRYLANLVSSFIVGKNEVTIACPKWLVNSIEELFDDFNISTSSVNLIISNKEPVIWSIYDKLKKGKVLKKSRRIKILYTLYDIIENILTNLISISSVLILILTGLIVIIFGIFMLPLVLIGYISYLIYKVFRSIKTKSKFKFKETFNVFKMFYNTFSASRISFYDNMATKLQSIVRLNLATKINKLSCDVDLWYSPSFFWPEFNDINGVRVVNAPDLVTSEHAMIWSKYSETIISKKLCEETIELSDYFITYSEFIKKTLLIDKFGKCRTNIVAIPHIINDLKTHIDVDKNLKEDFSLTCYNDIFARQILQTLYSHCNVNQDYIRNFDFSDTKYIFYASQMRVHKNILNLIKAYEYVLRDKYYNIKLFLTCDLKQNKEIYNYICDKRLQYDVLGFYNVSTQQLAALYNCAELVVNPTLYEGGFPFTFGEGMSVGTPSVMSKIPQVMEVIEGYDLSEMLFDPYDWTNIADKIIFGLDNKNELYKKELELYNDMKKRSSIDLADEYVKTFENFIKIEERNGKN